MENEKKEKKTKFSIHQIIGIIAMLVAVSAVAYAVYDSSDYKAEQVEKENKQIEKELDAVAEKIKPNVSVPQTIDELSENARVTVEVNLSNMDKYDYYYYREYREGKIVTKKLKESKFKLDENLFRSLEYDKMNFKDVSWNLWRIDIVPKGAKYDRGEILDSEGNPTYLLGEVQLFKSISVDKLYVRKLIELKASKNNKKYPKKDKLKQSILYAFKGKIHSEIVNTDVKYPLNKSNNIYKQKFNNVEATDDKYKDDYIPARGIKKVAYIIDEESGQKIRIIDTGFNYYDIEYPDYVESSDREYSTESYAKYEAENNYEWRKNNYSIDFEEDTENILYGIVSKDDEYYFIADTIYYEEN